MTTPTQDIFKRLEEDHDRHRELLDRIAQTQGESEEREQLFTRLVKEVKGHAAAEEQALYSTMMRKPEITSQVRHSVAEHHEIDELLNDLAATDMASGGWLMKFKHLDERYRHHIEEEEKDHFPDFAKHIDDEDARFMTQVFERRKQVESAEAEPEPIKREHAKA